MSQDATKLRTRRATEQQGPKLTVGGSEGPIPLMATIISVIARAMCVSRCEQRTSTYNSVLDYKEKGTLDEVDQ